MFVRSVVRLIEHEQANIAPKLDVAMAECVEEHVRRAHDDAMRFQHINPQRLLLPLVRFALARNEPDRDVDVCPDDVFLLARKCDSRCKEPGDLNWGGVSD